MSGRSLIRGQGIPHIEVRNESKPYKIDLGFCDFGEA